MSPGDYDLSADDSRRAAASENAWVRVKKITRRIVAVVGVLGCLLGIYALAGPALDQIDPTWQRCQVYSATPFQGGRGGTGYAVKMSTSCGEVWVKKGVTADNVKESAQKFNPKTQYMFEFGWLSRINLQLGPLHLTSATAQDWRPIPPHS